MSPDSSCPHTPWTPPGGRCFAISRSDDARSAPRRPVDRWCSLTHPSSRSRASRPSRRRRPRLRPRRSPMPLPRRRPLVYFPSSTSRHHTIRSRASSRVPLRPSRQTRRWDFGSDAGLPVSSCPSNGRPRAQWCPVCGTRIDDDTAASERRERGRGSQACAESLEQRTANRTEHLTGLPAPVAVACLSGLTIH